MTGRKVEAPAKVNLHLSVGKKRSDGFHALESVFARTSLCDELEVDILPGKTGKVRVLGLEVLCEPGKDTLSKAALLWMQASGKSMELVVRVKKRIPSQAGLGGGSSDAASLLRVLDSQFPIGEKALWEIAAKVGSDVPFFLSGHRMAWVTGRGEHVEPIEGVRPMYGVLVMPRALKCSTKEAYEALDAIDRPSAPAKKEVWEALLHGPSCYKGVMRNDFFELVEANQPYGSLMQASQGLDGYGALSGSGSCWFFVSEEKTIVSSYIGRIRELLPGQFESWEVLI